MGSLISLQSTKHSFSSTNNSIVRPEFNQTWATTNMGASPSHAKPPGLPHYFRITLEGKGKGEGEGRRGGEKG